MSQTVCSGSIPCATCVHVNEVREKRELRVGCRSQTGTARAIKRKALVSPSTRQREIPHLTAALFVFHRHQRFLCSTGCCIAWQHKLARSLSNYNLKRVHLSRGSGMQRGVHTAVPGLRYGAQHLEMMSLRLPNSSEFYYRLLFTAGVVFTVSGKFA